MDDFSEQQKQATFRILAELDASMARIAALKTGRDRRRSAMPVPVDRRTGRDRRHNEQRV